MRKQREHREWTESEYSLIVYMRSVHRQWSDIASAVHDTVENTIAAYRRATGTKHSAYKNLEEPTLLKAVESPKIAIMDIETLPMKAYVWGMFDQYISTEQVIEDICMLGWAGKWLGNPKMYSDILNPDEARARDTERITASAWDFMSKADIVVGHNFVSFDNKVLNLEFLSNGLNRLKPIIVDTYLVAKNNFKFSSNKLEFINKKLGMRNKLDTGGFPLWSRCSDGDPEALQKMRDYNIGDIYSTEDLFLKFRPYVRNINIGLYIETELSVCPVCGDSHMHQEGFYYTPAGKWPAMRCENCGCLTRTKGNRVSIHDSNKLSKNERQLLLVNS